MQTKRIEYVLKDVLEKTEPPEEDIKIIKNSLEEFLDKVKNKIKKLDVEVFVGGSFAKKTMIKKDNYDLDIFLRFNKKYKDKDISNLTKKILDNLANVVKVHGSRDYFRINISPSFFIEIIPVIKVNSPKESDNITDLSYSHVKYIRKKIKSQKMLDDIKIAKVFCYANKCYGAESYIRGFSGYVLELLVYHYKSFLNFIKAMSKAEEKIIVDIEKQYKNKQQILMDMNGSKLKSPIIVIDPTYNQRNACAALSDETFAKFKKICKEFLKNPSIKYFEIKINDLEKIKEKAKRKKFDFILLEAKTNKQEGDIAGTKLLKFYNHLADELRIFFDIKEKGFDYFGKKSAKYFFVVVNKKEILFDGPSLKDKKNILAFKKKHKKIFNLKGKVYAKEKMKLNIKEFIEKWKIKNGKKIKEMDVESLNINLI